MLFYMGGAVLHDRCCFTDLRLTVNTDMISVVLAMLRSDSGLEIRNRQWLKITIPNAFIGRRQQSEATS